MTWTAAVFIIVFLVILIISEIVCEIRSAKSDRNFENYVSTPEQTENTAAATRTNEEGGSSPPPIPPKRSAEATPPPPLPVRRPPPLSRAAATRELTPEEYPCCPLCRQRNRAGEQQLIFEYEGGYICSRAHRFRKNGRLYNMR